MDSKGLRVTPDSASASMKSPGPLPTSNSFATLQCPEEVCSTQGLDRNGCRQVEANSVISSFPADEAREPLSESPLQTTYLDQAGNSDALDLPPCVPTLPSDTLLTAAPNRPALIGSSSSPSLQVAGGSKPSPPMQRDCPPPILVEKTGEYFQPKSILKKPKGPKRIYSPSSKSHG
ncbi:hypothetical protein Nepgr_010451 [Nepenthes gracilis]|uniref:Uncharacterized protein n=1 Tax=Nepenthes gracilis TaxID=150966 RepID=A0AAD3XLE5_NEPGR|nr:hypothetical protein Nepgr_010451 [Nepenthes gracilis]